MALLATEQGETMGAARAARPGRFVMAGGGTGGHVMPLLAVARELRSRGHEVVFFGTESGMESRLVPAEAFPLERIRIGSLKGQGLMRRLRTLWQLPLSALAVSRRMGRQRPAAVFSLGGYVAGPTVLAAVLRRVPLVVMEPNAVPGVTNLKIGRFAARVLVGFAETAKYFPASRTEVTGMPVREEFFGVPAQTPGRTLRILITGGSRGSRTLNQASRASWPLIRAAGLPVRIVHQCGREDFAALHEDFAHSGLEGEIAPFLDDMPRAFAEADLVICRAGASTVSELAAAGRPSILVPFPYAADQHQLRNAEAIERAGAGRVVLDREMTGERLFEIVQKFAEAPGVLAAMGKAAKALAHPGAARRAASILEEAGGLSSSNA